MQELQLSPISAKFVPPQPQDQQAQLVSKAVDMPTMGEKAGQNPEVPEQIQQFSPPDDLMIGSSVLTAPLEPQFDFNLLYHLQAGMQHSQDHRTMHHRGPPNQRSYGPPKFTLGPASHDRFIGMN